MLRIQSPPPPPPPPQTKKQKSPNYLRMQWQRIKPCLNWSGIFFSYMRIKKLFIKINVLTDNTHTKKKRSISKCASQIKIFKMKFPLAKYHLFSDWFTCDLRQSLVFILFLNHLISYFMRDKSYLDAHAPQIGDPVWREILEPVLWICELFDVLIIQTHGSHDLPLVFQTTCLCCYFCLNKKVGINLRFQNVLLFREKPLHYF